MAIKLPIDHLTGVILAGGQSRRFGSDKAFASYEGESFLQRVMETMKGVFREVVIVTNFSEKFKKFSIPILKDKIPFQGPLGGIVTALRSLKTKGIFAVACDMPLLTKEAILHLIEGDDGSPLVLYRRGKRVEPLCAIYRTFLLPLLEFRLRFGRLDLHSLCQDPIPICKVTLKQKEKKSLMNVNTFRQYRSLLDEKGAID